MRYTIAAILLFAFCSHLKAQDPRFAQFYASPDQLNPALNVVYEGQARFIINYRDQWASVLNDVPFRTMAAHLDYRFNVAKNDYFAVGINGLRDEAGSSNFNTLNGNLNLSYMKYLGGGRNKSYYLVAGAQGGFGQRKIDLGNLWFSEQFDDASTSIDFNLPTGEAVNTQSNLYPDFSAGLMWYTIIRDNSFYIGGALYHINSPNVSLYENQIDPLLQRYVGHLGGELQLNNNLSLLPAAAVYFQGPSTDINLGANVRYSSGDNDLAMRIGAWAHLSNQLENSMSLEALTVTTLLEMETWTLGLSYDINVSQLVTASNSKGAFEASFTYIIPEKGRRSRVSCPKF